jgi:hypothetical protein
VVNDSVARNNRDTSLIWTAAETSIGQWAKYGQVKIPLFFLPDLPDRFEPEEFHRRAPKNLVTLGFREMSQKTRDPFALLAVTRACSGCAEAAAVHEAVGSERVGELLEDGLGIAVRIAVAARNGRELHHHVVVLGPAQHNRVLLPRPLKRPSEMIDEHTSFLELLDERLEAFGMSGLEVKLHGHAGVDRRLPEQFEFGFIERWQTVGVVGVDAHCYERQFPGEFLQPGWAGGSIREEETGALELSLADREAVLQIAMILLIRLGVNHDGVIHARLGHAFEQVFGCGGVIGSVGAISVVRESRIVLAGKAVQVRVDDGNALIGRGKPRRRGDHGKCGGSKKLTTGRHGETSGVRSVLTSAQEGTFGFHERFSCVTRLLHWEVLLTTLPNCSGKPTMKAMLVSIFSFAIVLLVTVPCQAIKITAFTDTDTFTDRAKDIVIAKCGPVPADASSYEDGLYPVDVEVIHVVKGGEKEKGDAAQKNVKMKLGKLKIATIYTMEAGKTYLLTSMGGSAFGTEFLAIPELSVVELPTSFRLDDLKDKTVKEQVQAIFAARRQENERQKQRLELERKLLDKAFAKPMR